MKRIQTIIADDERLAREIMRTSMMMHPSVEIVAECSDGFEAVKKVNELDPDLLILDIQMPKLNGFEVLELIENPPIVIFSTAFDEYALKAFEVNALDYILKPFSDERITEALQRVEKIIKTGKKTNLSAEGIEQPQTILERIAVKDGSQIYLLNTNEIKRVEAMDDYIVIYHNFKKYYKKQTMKQIEKQVDPSKFVRIHRSHLVNSAHISRIEQAGSDGHSLLLDDNSRLPVSKSGFAEIKIKLGIK